MATVPLLYQQAFQNQQAGNYAAAEHIYRGILEQDETQAEAWHLLGVMYSQRGDHQRGLECVLKALAINDKQATYHGNAGVMYRALGMFDESIASYRRALEIAPEFADAHGNLANLLAAQGHLDDALVHYAKAIWHKPSFAEAYFGIGRLLQAKNRLGEAIGFCRGAVDMKPELADAHELLAEMHYATGKLAEARTAIQETLRLKPNSSAAHFRLATILLAERKLPLAAQSLRAAIAADPQSSAAHCQLAGLLLQQDQLDEAREHFEKALAIDPSMPEAHCGLGVIKSRQFLHSAATEHLQRAIELRPDYTQAIIQLATASVLLGRHEEAHACYERLLYLQPDHHDAHCDRSMLLLSEGRYAEGWREYEWRWKRSDARNVRYNAPRWTGTPLPGKTLLVHTEQGFGDTLQFIRYAALVKQRVGRLIVECAPALVSLLQRHPAIDEVVTRGTTLPAFDAHAPLLSLPGVFGTTLESIPAEIPYLTPAAEAVEQWREVFASAKGLRIGLNWQGSPSHALDRLRSLPLEALVPLGEVPSVQLYSLQTGAGREQLKPLADRLPIIDLGDQLGDFHNTAAALAHLDLAITCDSAVGHLAGATGRPVWILLAQTCDWRWLLDREDSPWYPTARLFRQRERDEWGEDIQRVVRALGERK